MVKCVCSCRHCVSKLAHGILLLCPFAGCVGTMVLCIVVRLVFIIYVLFCNGVWLCADVCCVSSIVECTCVCVLYVSFGSSVTFDILGWVFMGSVVMSICVDWCYILQGLV